MNDRNVFLLSAGLTMLGTLAVSLLQAKLPGPGERALASGTTVATFENACTLSGVIAEKDDTVAVEFEVANPGDRKAEVSFYYSVQCTPAMSPYSRMMPRPSVITNGCCTLTVEGNGAMIERIVLPRRATEVDPLARAGIDPPGSPAQWVLSVSSREITNGLAWGGVPPVAALTTNRLGQGTLILARTMDSPPTEADEGS